MRVAQKILRWMDGKVLKTTDVRRAISGSTPRACETFEYTFSPGGNPERSCSLSSLSRSEIDKSMMASICSLANAWPRCRKLTTASLAIQRSAKRSVCIRRARRRRISSHFRSMPNGSPSSIRESISRGNLPSRICSMPGADSDADSLARMLPAFRSCWSGLRGADPGGKGVTLPLSRSEAGLRGLRFLTAPPCPRPAARWP